MYKPRQILISLSTENLLNLHSSIGLKPITKQRRTSNSRNRLTKISRNMNFKSQLTDILKGATPEEKERIGGICKTVEKLLNEGRKNEAVKYLTHIKKTENESIVNK